MSLLAPLLLALAAAAPLQGRHRPPAGAEAIKIDRPDYPVYMELYPRRDDGGAEAAGHEPMLVLFHEARGSRGEYRAIAPVLAARGYTCLAVDLGVGRGGHGVPNQTSYAAFGRGHFPDYMRAWKDMQDALRWAREHHPDGQVVAWGSGFSAGLALATATTLPDLADGAVAFSPSECFTAVGKSATWVAECLADTEVPVFLAGPAGEGSEIKAFFEAAKSGARGLFVPETGGEPGTQMLLEASPQHAACWAALDAFLAASFPVVPAASPAGNEPESPR